MSRWVPCKRHHQKHARRSIANYTLHLWLLLAFLLLASCTNGGHPEKTVPLIPTSTPPPPTAHPLPDNATVGARIQTRGHLVVGIRYDLPPFGYVTDEGTVAGFGVDVGKELARRWLGNPEAVQFRQGKYRVLREKRVEIHCLPFNLTSKRYIIKYFGNNSRFRQVFPD